MSELSQKVQKICGSVPEKARTKVKLRPGDTRKIRWKSDKSSCDRTGQEGPLKDGLQFHQLAIVTRVER